MSAPKKPKHFWFLLYIAAVLAVALLLNFLMWLPIPTFGSLGAEHWLGFWGSYLGGALGCLPAIAALVENRRESKRQHEETERDRHFSRLPMIDSAIERISYISSLDPGTITAVMEIDPGTVSFRWKACDRAYLESLSWEKALFLLDLENIGFGPALDLSVRFLCDTDFSIGTLQEHQSFRLLVAISPEMVEPYIDHGAQLQAEFSFKDILEWRYAQSQEFHILPDKAIFSPISSPEHLVK